MTKRITDELTRLAADAWVIYDYGGTNPVFREIVGSYHLTRKSFVIIRKNGEAVIVCHSIDSGVIMQKGMSLPAKVISYNRWRELIDTLERELEGCSSVLMEISENGLLPRVSYADYGTVRLIESLGCTVSSSADLFQMIVSKMSPASYRLHVKAAQSVTRIKDEAFGYLFQQLAEKGEVSEYDVQQFILRKFDNEGMVTDSPPIVAIARNAANPHYEPSVNDTAFIRRGDVILIDLWAKYADDNAVFGDITWMGYAGEDIPVRYQHIFDVLKDASDAAINYIKLNLKKRKICGFEVDDVCREVVERNGFGEFFTHRTGHSLSVGASDHGTGVNIDNYETHDVREIINGVGFSIEPGIYIEEEIGVREECNVCIWDEDVVVTTPRQEKILRPSDYGVCLT